MKCTDRNRLWANFRASAANNGKTLNSCSEIEPSSNTGSLRRYQVSFHTAPNEQIVYVVYYAFSPDAEQGYVYLPGDSDEWAGLNVRSIWRGVEGK